MGKLIVFDVDGVLIDTDKGSTKDILIQLGKGKEVEELHQEYLRRRHQGPWGLKELMELFRGYSRGELMEISRTYCSSHLMKGAADTILELKKRGYEVGVITSSAEIVTHTLLEMLPLDWAEATVLRWDEGVCAGEISRMIDRFTKKEILSEYMKTHHIAQENAIAVGDSITDVPIAQAVGEMIAFNATDAPLLERADVHVREKNLTILLSYI